MNRLNIVFSLCPIPGCNEVALLVTLIQLLKMYVSRFLLLV